MQGYLRGHGTYVEEGTDGGPPRLVACVAGVVERVNKLISVRPIKTRYGLVVAAAVDRRAPRFPLSSRQRTTLPSEIAL